MVILVSLIGRMEQEIPIRRYLAQQFEDLNLVGLGCAVSWVDRVSAFCYGVNDLDHRIPINGQSVFNIASVGKFLTTVAILSLIEKRDIQLHTKLGHVLHDLPDQWKKIAIKHLLSHSSGIKNYTAVKTYWDETTLDVSRDRILDYVRDYPLEFEPGTQWQYSNTGFFLLGLIIEAVTGGGYFDYVDKMITGFKPGLQIYPTRDTLTIPGRVSGYRLENNVHVKAPYYSPSGTFSAGGYSGSLPDFLEFENAFFKGKILSTGSVEIISRSFITSNGKVLHVGDAISGFEMTLGLFKFKKFGKTVLAHGGQIAGFSTNYLRVPEEHLSIIVSVNTENVHEVEAISERVMEIMLGGKLPNIESP